jgi:hypothetical protein
LLIANFTRLLEQVKSINIMTTVKVVI